MGDPSYVEYQDIELYEDKVKEFEKLVEKNKDKEYWGIIEIREKEIELDLNDYKIIQYWYKEFLEFLKEIAPYIKEGNITLHCPGYQEYGEICFEEGKVHLMLAKHPQLERYELEDLRKVK